MEMLITILIGAAVGAGITVAIIFEGFTVMKNESWKAYELEGNAQRELVTKVVAENANLRVALAAGEMTEDSKKVATMTMTALNVVIATAKGAKQSRDD